jgi:hypothetical protein
MSKVKKIALAAALALAILTAFHQTKLARDARAEAQQLREQQARSATEITNLKDSLADRDNQVTDLIAENSRLRSNPNETELLKLRGEVTRLRPLQDDVVALQKMLRETSAGLPAWKTNELANVGRANPIDAFQTYLCAAQQTNSVEIQNSIVGDGVDPISPEALQSFIDNTSNHPGGGNVIGFKILSETWLAPDKVQVELSETVSKNGLGISLPFTLRNVNGEWKIEVFNARNVDGKVSSIEFFKESP